MHTHAQTYIYRSVRTVMHAIVCDTQMVAVVVHAHFVYFIFVIFAVFVSFLRAAVAQPIRGYFTFLLLVFRHIVL